MDAHMIDIIVIIQTESLALLLQQMRPNRILVKTFFVINYGFGIKEERIK